MNELRVNMRHGSKQTTLLALGIKRRSMSWVPCSESVELSNDYEVRPAFLRSWACRRRVRNRGTIPAQASAMWGSARQSIPILHYILYTHQYARVAELVYAHDLKSCPSGVMGSIPIPGTFKFLLKVTHLSLYYGYILYPLVLFVLMLKTQKSQ